MFIANNRAENSQKCSWRKLHRRFDDLLQTQSCRPFQIYWVWKSEISWKSKNFLESAFGNIESSLVLIILSSCERNCSHLWKKTAQNLFWNRLLLRTVTLAWRYHLDMRKANHSNSNIRFLWLLGSAWRHSTKRFDVFQKIVIEFFRIHQ